MFAVSRIDDMYWTKKMLCCHSRKVQIQTKSKTSPEEPKIKLLTGRSEIGCLISNLVCYSLFGIKQVTPNVNRPADRTLTILSQSRDSNAPLNMTRPKMLIGNNVYLHNTYDHLPSDEGEAQISLFSWGSDVR